MKIYIVTESDTKSNFVLRSWVCFTKEQANECLQKQYKIACTYNQIADKDEPTDCTKHDFFFWTLQSGQELKYEICESKTYAE